jgi:hypothetical protein
MVDVQAPNRSIRTFKGSGFWLFNAKMAAVAGLGAGLLMSVNSVNVLRMGSDKRIGTGLLLTAIVVLLCSYWPGNLISMYPYEITVEKGKGLWIHAAFRKTYVPSADLQDVRHTGIGTSVRLKRRQRLLRAFYIHWAFGPEAGPLADAIRDEIRYRS